ncbi:MAG: T9SS type A sorting domain-containing protein [Chitinophagales bacterium]
MQQAKYYITTCLLAIAFTINAQLPTGPEIAWQRCYGTSGGDNFFDAIVTSDNSIVASIYYGGYDGDATGLFSLSLPAGLIKFDSDFNVIWQNFFGGSDNISYFKKVVELNNSYIAAAGNSSAYDVDFPDNHGNLDFIIVSTDYNGNKLWSKSYGGPGVDETEGFIATLDGGYLLTGSTNGSGGDIPFHYGSGFTNDAIVIKTDSMGEILWLKVLGGSANDSPIGDVVEIDRGYYIINIGTYSNDYDLTDSGFEGLKRWIIKIDSLGNKVDESFMEGNVDLYTYTNDMVIPFGDGFMVVGNGNANSLLYPTSPEHALEEGAVAIFNADLELTFFKQWGGGHIDGFKRVVQDQNGNFIFLGYSESIDYDLPGNYNGGETVDYWLFATDSNFNPLWSKNFGGSAPCGDLGCSNFSGNLVLKDNMLLAFIKNTIPDSFPDYDIECGMEGTNDYYTDAWLIAFDLTTAIQQENIPQQIFAITPNPANNTIFISSTVSINAHLQITLTSLNGILVFKEEVYFTDTLQLNIPDLTDGMYIIQCLNTSVQNAQLLLIIQP